MRRLALSFYLLTAAVFGPLSAMAQTSSGGVLDSLVKKIDYYSRRHPAELMFVHLDKTIYVGNENIWFTAYIINSSPAELGRHQVLSAALVSDDDNTMAAAEKFISAGRLAFGHLSLPDTIAPGNYTFIAYTNRKVNGKPAAFFSQPITIKSATQPQFDVVAKVDTSLKHTEGIVVNLKGSTQNGALAGASINYVLGVNKKTRINGRGKTDASGNYQIIIPRNRISADQHILDISVKKGEEVKTIKLFMPIARTANNVRFYPEGGYLVSGIMNLIAWEARNAGGSPLKATAVLYAGNRAVDTIATNSYGMGTFSLKPADKIAYSVKMISPLNTDTVYRLPAAIHKGVSMHVVNALVNDTLRFRIQALQPQAIYLMVQNYNQVFATMPVRLETGRRSVAIDLTHVPRGLNSVVLLDSLWRPLAERMFFAHYGQKIGVNIATNAQEYGLRKKVTLTLRLKSKDGKPVQGIVSVACAQENRFDLKKDNNIENYVYLRSALDNLPLKEHYMANAEADMQYLNELLLVRGWSRYKWVEMEKAAAADTLQKLDSMLFSAKLTWINRKIKKPLQLLVMHDSSSVFEMLTSDDKGNVSIGNTNVVSRFGKKVRMIVSGESSEYIIDVTDPYKEENKLLALAHQSADFEEPPAEVDTRNLILKGMERATHLREVKILARKDQSLYRKAPAWNTNKCGDYVCTYHILNCNNHRFDPQSRPPMAGEMVHINGIGLSPYPGCMDDDLKAGMIAVKGIYEAQEFYGADYTIINPTEPDYLSTICWKHAVSVSSEADIQFSFYTSDITGAYRIVVQGLADGEVIYGERTINVKKQLP